MTQEQYNHLVSFLNRADIKGSESANFIKAINALTDLYNNQSENQ